MIEEEKIFSWLTKVEGQMVTRGYIPCWIAGTGRKKSKNYRGDNGSPSSVEAMGVSGVTIGVGVDLGQQTESQLRYWGVSAALMDKLRPYIGKKKHAACVALNLKPLTLTEDETRELCNAEHHGYMVDEVERVWNYSYGRNGKYADLPWQAQCVIFSLVYQLGWGGLRRRGPATLAALEAHDWPRAVRNLLSGAKGWNGEYWQRRAVEGRLLAELC